jgi:asparagine synthase (glutamine-hydrolysing)
MCGIAGAIALDGAPFLDHALLTRMADALNHRGPDDRGYFSQGNAGFAFTRLSIVDLSGGNQPHFNEDRTVVSICNGEIYNYRDLRTRLHSQGHRLETSCDVEVLPHLYEDLGAGLLDRISGQFAFAIADLKRRQFVLARDHVGIAPLFYTVCGNLLLFASEIKAILTHPCVERRVDLRGLDQILTFPGIVSPRTMFANIRALRPGHYLSVRDGKAEEIEYWDLDYPALPDLARQEPDQQHHVRRLDELLNKSVVARLQADVPVGFYLSGGLDSSLLGCLIGAAAPDESRHSFSIVFPNPRIDERPYQRQMAQHLGSQHHEIEFDAEDIGKALRQAVWTAETPLKESYNTCSLALSSLVRKTGLKVVITGEGADELFAGYVGYRFDQARAAGAAEAGSAEWFMEQDVRETLWGDAGFWYEKDYFAYRDTRAALYSDDVLSCMEDFDCTREPVVNGARMRNRHRIHQRSYVDFKLRLSDHLVSDHGDRVSYANSVEARYPFLDLDLIEYSRTIPPELYVKGGIEKYLIRSVAAKYLPPAILNREKFGFVAPGSPGLLHRQTDWVEDLLSTETIRRQGYFNPRTIQQLRDRHSRPGAAVNTTFENDFLMVVLTFGILLDRFNLPCCG